MTDRRIPINTPEGALAEANRRVAELEKALSTWVTARKVILSFEDHKGAEFKAAWNALGEAEWALADLAPINGRLA